jgi:hypothetical protein
MSRPFTEADYLRAVASIRNLGENLMITADLAERHLADQRARTKARSLPLLHTHAPLAADSHDPSLVVGAIGSNVRFIEPYLFADDIVVWSGDAIRDIESMTKFSPEQDAAIATLIAAVPAIGACGRLIHGLL